MKFLDGNFRKKIDDVDSEMKQEAKKENYTENYLTELYFT